MARHLLDSDISILWLKNHPGVRSQVERHGGLSRMAVTTLTVAEVYEGAYLFPHSDTGMKVTDSFFRAVSVVPFTHEAAKRFAALRARIAHFDSKHNFDLMNACIALTHDYTIVTRNVKHYQYLPGLRVVNWASGFH